MSEPAIYFVSHHGPIVGEWWNCVIGGWDDVEVIAVQGRTVLARVRGETWSYRWGLIPFMRSFTRLP